MWSTLTRGVGSMESLSGLSSGGTKPLDGAVVPLPSSPSLRSGPVEETSRLSLGETATESAGAESEGPPQLQRWLANALRLERDMVAQQLTSRHALLLDELRNRVESEVSKEGKLPLRRSGAWCDEPEKANTSSSLHRMRTVRDWWLIPEFEFDKKFSDATTAQVVQESRRRSRFEMIVKSHLFEFVFAGLILANSVLTALQIQYIGIDNGHQLGYPRYKSVASEEWPGADAILTNLDGIFTVVFTLELMLRIFAYRQQWLLMMWSYIDTTIVVLSIFTWSNSAWGVDPTIARLLRLGKLVRIVRIMRSNAILESLKLLTASIQASAHTLFWSLFVLLVFQSVAGIILGQLVEPFLLNDDNPIEIRRLIFGHFGTFYRSMVTMFEITFANWGPICRLLVDSVGESFGVFFLVYRCVIGFAVLSVINAVFVQQTMRSAQLDDNYLVECKNRERAKIARKLRKVFQQIDTSGDGFVSWGEFEPILAEDHMKLMMSTLEVDVGDLETLFKLLDDGDGQISCDAFVKGLMSMRGQAKSIDLVTLLNIARRVEAKLDATNLVNEWRNPPHNFKDVAARVMQSCHDMKHLVGHSKSDLLSHARSESSLLNRR